jgi:hypothetical protein
MRVTPVLVTRGNVDLSEILRSFNNGHWSRSAAEQIVWDNIVIWDNSKLLNFGPFGQYVAATTANCSDIVFFQDDDCVTDPAEICQHWEVGKIVCNMPQEHQANYVKEPDKLMGFGSVFSRSLIRPTFERYNKLFPVDPVNYREPGRIFTALNQPRLKVVDVPVKNLPWATGDDRLYKQTIHMEMARVARGRALAVLEAEE